MDRARLGPVLVAFAAYHASDRSGMGPQQLNQMQVSALCLVHGLAVVPSHGTKDGRCTCPDKNCKRPGRHPCTPRGLEDATTDPELVYQFWIKWPKAKVIIATGEQNVIAVTVNGRKGQQSYDSLVGKEGAEDSKNDESSSKTIEFRGRRTHTYLWRVPDNAIPIGRVRLAEGVVVHGVGSFIVVPRNMTSPGRSRQLYDTEIGPAPSRLLTRLGAEPIAESTSPEKLPISEPKSAERLMIPERTFTETLHFELYVLELDWIVIPDTIPPCNDDRVRALAESYRITVVRAPLAVREVAEQTRDSHAVFSLLSDPHRLEALKRLGIKYADCLVIKGDETDERLWKLAELIHQPEVKVLDWAHMVMEWVRLVREKGAQVAHPRGGRQPHDKGLAAAERVLGVSRRDLARAALIASISPEAQEEIRRTNLDDIQRALLEIANEPPEEQVEKARQVKERYRKPRRKRVTNADMRETGAQQGQTVENEHTSLAPNEDESDQAEDNAAESPSTAPEEPSGDIEQPSALERRASDDEKFERLKSLWEQFMADEWEEASEKVHRRFLKNFLGYSVVAANKAGKSHH